MALHPFRLRRALSLSFSILHRSLHETKPIFPYLPSVPRPTRTPIPFSTQLTTRLFTSTTTVFRKTCDPETDEIGPDTILFEGCDYNHWLITMDFPKDSNITREQMIETYVNTAARVFGRYCFLCSFICLYQTSFDLHRRYSTTILTQNASEGSFPSELLSSNRVLTPEREIGLYQDLMIPVTNFSNEDKGFMVLAGDVFDVPIRKDIIHRVVRWQLAKRQQGTHSTKTISEVSGTGRKPWKQKGTGRARHGTLRGPQFRGGAPMHGPKPRSHAIKLNKKVRRLGLKIALSARAAEGKLVVFDDLEVPSHKTKNIVNYVQQMENAKKFLLVDGGPINEKLKLARQNLHYVNVLPSIGLNVYSILLHDTLVMSRDAVNRIVERMHAPINR